MYSNIRRGPVGRMWISPTSPGGSSVPDSSRMLSSQSTGRPAAPWWAGHSSPVIITRPTFSLDP